MKVYVRKLLGLFPGDHCLIPKVSLDDGSSLQAPPSLSQAVSSAFRIRWLLVIFWAGVGSSTASEWGSGGGTEPAGSPGVTGQQEGEAEIISWSKR